MPLNAPVSCETLKPRPRFLAALIAAGLCAFLGQGAVAQQTTDAVAPEASTAGSSSHMRKAATANNWMISAANPLAVEAGANILRSGGNAIDAMVTMQTMLGLVEPQSSGLGGGAFLVYFDAASGKLTTLDGRETAPLNAKPTLFQDENGEPLKFYDAVVGGRSVGTPGTPALMKTAHEKWGQLPWNSLFDPAIDVARTGFEVSPRLAALIADDQEKLSRDPEAEGYFFDKDGAPLAAGTLLRNPKYAKTLQDLAVNGTVNFYQGQIAQDIVDKVKGASWNPGLLSLADFATYHVKERPAVCIEYRDHDVCGMGPPSSGALTVGQILGLVEPYDIAAMGPDSAQSWRLIGDASRLAFADRGRYMADIDFVPMPLTGLLDKTYLAERSKLLDRDTALETVEPGMPSFSHAMKLADDEAIELPSTSHFSIVDIYGNAVSMTTTIVMKDDKPVIVTGSPGGSRIIGYVAQSVIGMIDWNMSPNDAIDMPHLVNRFGTFDLEAGTDAEKLAPVLEGMGFKTSIRDLNSGIHAIMVTENGLIGGADSRREGIVVGE